MAVSQVELCNLALSRAGGHRIAQITSLGEASNEARQCAVKLPHLIRTALRSHPWQFAMKKIVLAQVKLDLTSENQNNYFNQEKILYGSNYLYQYPEDCLTAHALYEANSMQNMDYQADFNGNFNGSFHVELAHDGTKIIVSNILNAVLIYTAYLADVRLWDSVFYDALAWQLASELCISLGNDVQKSKEFEAKALDVFDRAKTLNNKESHQNFISSSYLKARA